MTDSRGLMSMESKTSNKLGWTAVALFVAAGISGALLSRRPGRTPPTRGGWTELGPNDFLNCELSRDEINHIAAVFDIIVQSEDVEPAERETRIYKVRERWAERSANGETTLLQDLALAATFAGAATDSEVIAGSLDIVASSPLWDASSRERMSELIGEVRAQEDIVGINPEILLQVRKEQLEEFKGGSVDTFSEQVLLIAGSCFLAAKIGDKDALYGNALPTLVRFQSTD